MAKQVTLIEQIKSAFQKSQYPSDNDIISNIDKYAESHEMWLAFKGRWQDVSATVVEDYRMSFARFTPEGFCYYLPLLLLTALDSEPYEVDAYLIQDLSPPEDSEKKKLFDYKMSLLSQQQKNVVKKFVMHYIDENPLFAEKHSETLQYWKDMTDN